MSLAIVSSSVETHSSGEKVSLGHVNYQYFILTAIKYNTENHILLKLHHSPLPNNKKTNKQQQKNN